MTRKNQQFSCIKSLGKSLPSQANAHAFGEGRVLGDKAIPPLRELEGPGIGTVVFNTAETEDVKEYVSMSPKGSSVSLAWRCSDFAKCLATSGKIA